MEKHELVGMTLDKLIEHFKVSPESFEYADRERDKGVNVSNPTIVWQPKVQLNDFMSTIALDPNNENHSVIVVFSNIMSNISCYIFLHPVVDFNGAKADSIMSSTRWFKKLRGNYRKFKKLRNLILDRDRRRHNTVYLKKLSSVFPDTLDNHFLQD